ncbi:MAG: aminotransferase class V-fold PLP-dependent enzyme [Xanthomonadales bacterium]|nr:aminotransferase class V-fold PLP-dependent enzyme [Xanthomonadales bacterium]
MTADQFPVLSHGIYANHAAISPWPRVSADAVAAFARENAELGPTGYRSWIRRERELREKIVRLVNAPSIDDIALLQNTTEGVSLVAYGYPWAKGDNVVLPAGEFPSNRLPWLAQSARGVDVREVDIRVENPEDALLDRLDGRTQVLAVSSVQYSDGLRLDIEKLGAACEGEGVLFFVDAIQHLGALPFDVQAAGVGCLSAGAHKWLLGPEGLGVFYCREAERERIGLRQAGWHMYDYPWHFERTDWTPSANARRFEAGSPNSLGQVALHASLGLLLDTGSALIAERIRANSHRLASGIEDFPGLRVCSRMSAERVSGIVSFRSDGDGTRDLFKRLMQSGVTCAFRNGCVRLSPHFYQDDMVIDEILNRLEGCL